jgi:hypothetical protein
MPIDPSTLATTLGAAETAAGSAVNGLNSNSTMADVTQAQLKMTQYQLLATAVSSIISTDGEAKKTAARNINAG